MLWSVGLACCILGMVGEEGDRELERALLAGCWPDMEERKKATSGGGGGGGPIDFRFSLSLPSFSCTAAAVAAALFTMFNSAVSATSHFRDGERASDPPSFFLSCSFLRSIRSSADYAVRYFL